MELLLYYLILFVVSLCATWWIFKIVLKIAKIKNIVDKPDARKLQPVPVPVMGGVAVFFGMVVAFAAAGIVYDISNMFAMICVMTIMLYIGTMDDIVGLSPRMRFLVEIVVVLILIYCNDYSIDNFHGLWGIYKIPQWIAVPLTVFACVGIMNAINLIDGVNGLSSGYCIVNSIIFGTLFLETGNVTCASLAILSVGALIPFFCHNVFGKKSKMFIGDGGALLMGTILSSYVINALKTGSSMSVYLPDNFGIIPFALAVMSIPVFDTIRVMISRICQGRSPFSPDKTHLHHLLIDLHFSHVGVTSFEIIANLFVVAGWYISYILGASIELQLYIVIFMAFMLTFGLYWFARRLEKKSNQIYILITRLGDKTHVGHTRWFEKFTMVLDRNY